MDSGVHIVVAPRSPIYRVGRSPDPFEAPSWAFVGADSTFGGRFDDPGGRHGVDPGDRFRVLYFASASVGAFGETLARFRPDLDALAQSRVDPSSSRLARPVVPAAWRLARRIGVTTLIPSLVFANLGTPETVQELRQALAPLALSLGLPDLDISALTGPHRALTQEVARYLYEQHDPSGTPLYHGIRYQSRFNMAWECWAVFTDRLLHRIVRVDPIAATDPGLYDAARILRLTIEQDGGRRYIEP